MNTDSTFKQHPLVKIDIPFTSMMDSGIETRDFSVDSFIIQANFSGRLHPNKGNPPVVTVPHGYGFYWLRAYNAGWTDNINAQGNGEYPRPLSGFDFEHKHQYIYNARRAQLVAMAGDAYVAYEPDVDASLGGTSGYENRSGSDWQLYFYLNDRIDNFNSTNDFYFDNAGSANCDIAVYRLPNA